MSKCYSCTYYRREMYNKNYCSNPLNTSTEVKEFYKTICQGDLRNTTLGYKIMKLYNKIISPVTQYQENKRIRYIEHIKRKYPEKFIK